jgi:molecular chaperone DnaJ
VEICDNCRGNGAEPGTPIETCTRCDGAGQLRAVQRTAFGQLVRQVVCDTCGGDGKIPQQPCAECRGRGRKAERRQLSVDIPAGIADEQRIRLTGRGHAGERGGPAGDLYVLVRVTEDERFVRDGNDLLCPLDVSAPDAALGKTVEVETLDGPHTIEIAPGTQPGTVINLAGKGMPSLRRGERGDQRVIVNVVIPRKLSGEQREMLERFRGTLTEENLRGAEEDGSIFARMRRAFR